MKLKLRKRRVVLVASSRAPSEFPLVLAKLDKYARGAEAVAIMQREPARGPYTAEGIAAYWAERERVELKETSRGATVALVFDAHRQKALVVKLKTAGIKVHEFGELRQFRHFHKEG